MKIEKVNIWVTFATNAAVVLGIVFLVIEIQQNTDAIRSQSSIAINDSLANLSQALYADPGLTDIWIRGRKSLDSLDAIERERFTAYVMERLNLAVYARELERADSKDVHIDWITIVHREIVENPGICEFISSVPFEPRDFWEPMIKDCLAQR